MPAACVDATNLPVSEGIREILITLGIALVLVMFVVYVFLQNWRATFIPMIAVPVSLVGTFAIFPLLGFSSTRCRCSASCSPSASSWTMPSSSSRRWSTTSKRACAEGRHAEGDGRSVGTRRQHRADSRRRVHPGRLHERDPGSAEQAVCHHDRHLGDDLGVQRLTLSPALSAMLLKPRQKATGLLSRFFAGFNRGFEAATRGYVRVSHGLVRKAFVGIALLAAFTALAASLAAGYRRASCPRKTMATS